MITETMVLVALRQKKWAEASSMAFKLYENRSIPLMKNISDAAKFAESQTGAEWLLTVWSELRWKEINDGEEI